MSKLGIYIGVMVIVFFFGGFLYLAIELKGNSMFLFFDYLREKELYGKIDDLISKINKGEILNIVTVAFRVILDFFSFIILIMLVYYLINLLFFKGVTFPLVRPFQFNMLRQKRVWLHFISLYTPIMLILILPFFYKELDNGYNYLIYVYAPIIITMFIVNLMITDINEEKVESSFIIQMVITLILFLVLLFSFWGELSLVIIPFIFVISYMLIGILKGTFVLMWRLIQQDYQAAKIAKANLAIIEFIPEKHLFSERKFSHPIRQFRSKITNEEIEEVIEKRLYKPKSERKRARGELLKERNGANFHISSALILASVIALFLSILFDNLNIDKLLMLFIIFLFIRLGRRSVEIVWAFYQDVIDKKTKNSNLTGGERLKLAVVSLAEIGLLSAFIGIFYRLFMAIPELESFSSMDIRSAVLLLFEQLSIQMLNVSFDRDIGLFLSTVHVIQIITAFCLMILAIASYIGSKEEDSEYELKYKDGEWELTEEIIVDKEGAQKHPIIRKGAYPSDPSVQRNLWENGEISTKEYARLIRALQEWESWKIENEDLKERWLAYGVKPKNNRRSSFKEAFKIGYQAYKDFRKKTK